MIRTRIRPRTRERGSVLPVCIVVVAGVGATVTTFLGRALVEQNRVRQEAAVERAAWRAQGALELAKNVVLNAPMVNGQNSALSAALASNPPLIAGTPVVIEPAGPARWYRLSARGTFAGSESLAQCLVRDGTVYVAYNYYIEDDNLGVSGQATGRIHTNKTLELYYSGGVYTDLVSAGTGFTYKSGADASNTTFLGGSNQNAASKTLLDNVDFAGLKTSAAYVAPAGLVAEVTLNKTTVTIKLYSASSTVSVAGTKTQKVLTGYTTTIVQSPVYVTVWDWVPVTTSSKVWVDGPPPDSGGSTGGGTDIAGGGSVPTGYWVTTKTTTLVYKQVKVVDHYVDTTTQTPVYSYVTIPSTVTQSVKGTLQSTVTQPASGVIYIPGTISSLKGDLNGNLTLVTDSTVTIKGNMRYIDSNNKYAYLNGTNPSAGDYVPNPAFVRNHSLAVIAAGDITYYMHEDSGVPNNFEINGSLISTTGRVGISNITVSSSGSVSVSGDEQKFNSIRRFGTIMSAKRPISTVLKSDGSLRHGFLTGASVYDSNLLTGPPPACPTDGQVEFLESMRLDPGASVGAGAVTFSSGVSAMPTLKNMSQLEAAIGSAKVDWGIDDNGAPIRQATATPGH